MYANDIKQVQIKSMCIGWPDEHKVSLEEGGAASGSNVIGIAEASRREGTSSAELSAEPKEPGVEALAALQPASSNIPSQQQIEQSQAPQGTAAETEPQADLSAEQTAEPNPPGVVQILPEISNVPLQPARKPQEKVKVKKKAARQGPALRSVEDVSPERSENTQDVSG